MYVHLYTNEAFGDSGKYSISVTQLYIGAIYFTLDVEFHIENISLFWRKYYLFIYRQESLYGWHRFETLFKHPLTHCDLVTPDGDINLYEH